MQEPPYQIKAYVSDVGVLLRCRNWEERIGRGVTHLTLDDEDEIMKTIPNEVSRMPSLWSFKLKKSKVKSLPGELFGSEIRQLSFQECPIKSVEGIQNMSELASLELIENNIQKLPNDIGLLTGLVKLVVSKNSLKTVPQSIGALENLTTLILCANGITTLPDSITNLIQLTHLDLSHNQLKALPPEIGKLENLITIVLSHNQLQELPASSAKFGKLRYLMLGNNRFASVPKTISKLPELLTMNMAANCITDMATANVGISAIILDKNSLTEVPHALFLCERLEKLSLQNNRITELPVLISHLKQLRALHLDGNPIEWLPDEVCQLSALKQLTLRETAIQELPRQFDSLRQLITIDLEQTPINFIYKNALNKGGVRGLMDEVATQRKLSAAALMADDGDGEGESTMNPKPAAKPASARGGHGSEEFPDDEDLADPRTLLPPEYEMSVAGGMGEDWA